MFRGTAFRWTALVVLVLAVILIPFFLFNDQIEAWSQSMLDATKDRAVAIGAFIAGLLAVDILVPIPSSIVSTAGGFFMGFVPGMLASFVGMTISCLVGYWLAVKFGRPLAARIVGDDELIRLDGLYKRFGDWIIIAMRAVPVFAEASVLFSGIARMRPGRFVLLSTLSNLGVSAVYSAVGAWSANVSSFLLAFGGAIVLPLIGMLLTRSWRVERKPNLPAA